MLAVLNKVDSDRAADILAAAALTAPGQQVDDTIAEGVRSLLREARAQLRLQETDNSPAAQAKIDEFLSRTYDEISVSKERLDAAVGRAGASGLLSPSAYNVIQPTTFEQRFRPLEASKKLVRDTILQPDDFQHLMNEKALPGEEEVFSLFVRERNTARNPHLFLVQTFRREVDQVAQSAWHIFPQIVDVTGAATPFELLKRFVDRFGIPLTVGSRRSKFIHDEELPKNPMSNEMTVDAMLPAGVEAFSTLSFQKTPNPAIVNVGLAYSIALDPYRAALKEFL